MAYESHSQHLGAEQILCASPMHIRHTFARPGCLLRTQVRRSCCSSLFEDEPCRQSLLSESRVSSHLHGVSALLLFEDCSDKCVYEMIPQLLHIEHCCKSVPVVLSLKSMCSLNFASRLAKPSRLLQKSKGCSNSIRDFLAESA